MSGLPASARISFIDKAILQWIVLPLLHTWRRLFCFPRGAGRPVDVRLAPTEAERRPYRVRMLRWSSPRRKWICLDSGRVLHMNRVSPEAFPDDLKYKNTLRDQEVIVKNVIRLPLDFFGYRSIMQLELANFIYMAFFQRKHLSDKDSFFSNNSRWLAIANISIGALHWKSVPCEAGWPYRDAFIHVCMLQRLLHVVAAQACYGCLLCLTYIEG